jgi:ribosomal protein S21
MPIVIRAQGNDSTHDVIKKFKKAVASTDIVQMAKDRRYYTKPSQQRQVKKTEVRRLRKRARALKKTKNISPATLQRLMERLDK